MSKGVLLFALNTELRYTDLAEIAVRRIKKHLSLPVTIVVNDEYKDVNQLFDKVLKIEETQVQHRIINDGVDSSTKIKWLNFSRSSAYDLSPYDETLVLDVDYLINSSHLKVCFELGKDFLVFNDSIDLSNTRNLSEFRTITPFSIRFYWATVFYFKKTLLNQIFFTLVKYVKDNWSYYCNLYNIKEPKFRNDFAFSIAIHLFFNSTVTDKFGYIPGKKFFTIDRDYLIGVNDTKMEFLVSNEVDTKLQPVAVNSIDVHVMNKHSILRIFNE